MNTYEILNLVKNYPNDGVLGKKIRESGLETLILSINGMTKEIDIKRDYPNESKLGDVVREFVLKNK